MQTSIGHTRFRTEPRFWAQHREATLNWLALGLLLAAWNAADNESSPKEQRPELLKGYSYVSVRAAARVGAAAQSPG